MPEQPTLNEWEARQRPAPEATVRAVADLLHRAGVSADEVVSVEALKVSEWETAIKNADGEAQVVPLRGASVVLTPAWEAGPRWPVVQPAAPTKVTFSGRAARERPPADGMERLLVLPDPQIGYRLGHDMEPEPFHDLAAMDAAVAMARVVRPDRIVCLGDTLDLPAFSTKFRQEPSFALCTQAAIDYAHGWLAALAKIAPVDLLEGNHDARLGAYVANNAMSAFGLRRANAPEEWPSLSVPSLLRIGEDELEDVTYHPGYPVGIVWVAPNLACIHGTRLKVSQVLDDERVCVVQGHTHRAELTYRQRRTFDGPALMWAASPGCLCRVDGAVPGVHAAVSDRDGRSIDRPQDWHQGVCIVTYDPTGERLPIYEFAPIRDGVCRWRDHTVTGGDR